VNSAFVAPRICARIADLIRELHGDRVSRLGVALRGRAKHDSVGIELAHLGREHRMQVGAMQVVILSAVASLVRGAERDLMEELASAIHAKLLRRRDHRNLRQRFFEPDAVQDARRVRADLDPGSDLAERGRLLVDAHAMAALE
jgi:hypothetical protein